MLPDPAPLVGRIGHDGVVSSGAELSCAGKVNRQADIFTTKPYVSEASVSVLYISILGRTICAVITVTVCHDHIDTLAQYLFQKRTIADHGITGRAEEGANDGRIAEREVERYAELGLDPGLVQKVGVARRGGNLQLRVRHVKSAALKKCSC